jgi:signal transduction histidine kinase
MEGNFTSIDMSEQIDLTNAAMMDLRDPVEARWMGPAPDWCQGRSAGEILERLEVPAHARHGAGRTLYSAAGHQVLSLRGEGYHTLVIAPVRASIHQARREFFAEFSHELRTPLNAVIGFSKLLEMEKPGDLNERQREFVNHVLTAAEQLLETINRGLLETKARVDP